MARRTRPATWHTQNFLRDPALARTLVDHARLNDTDLVHEIGAGTGTITAALADRCRAVIANEIDGPLCDGLRARFATRPTVQVRCGDFRTEPLPTEPYKVFANLPFNITSEIVAKLVGAARPPDDTFLVVQREAAERYCGAPSETLAALVLKPWFAPSIVHRFHRDDFTPKPSVEAVMLRLRKRGPPLVAAEDAQAYRDLVVSGLTAWRPTIGVALAQPFGQRAARRLLDAAALDPALRPSEVPFDAWLRLFDAFVRMPVALRDRIGGAESRLRHHQSHLRKEHRSRAPRDALGSAPRELAAMLSR
jgi:23S rRNA (adenine-N6)-dimethyltransferase